HCCSESYGNDGQERCESGSAGINKCSLLRSAKCNLGRIRFITVGDKVSIEFLDPTSKPANPSSWAIRDRTSLNGAKIGIIWNGRPNGDQLMEQITRRITDRFGA